jgi:CRP-like cAMP-binding protein
MITLGLWGPGDVVGRPLSCLDPYQIECLTAVEAEMLPNSVWNQMLNAILLHAQQEEEFLKIVHCQSIEQRLLQFLAWLGQKFGHDSQEGQIIQLRLTHQEIAETLNTSRVTVTRLLNQLEQQGIIQRSSRQWILCRH